MTGSPIANSRSTFFKNRNLFRTLLSEFFKREDPDMGELIRSAPAKDPPRLRALPGTMFMDVSLSGAVGAAAAVGVAAAWKKVAKCWSSWSPFPHSRMGRGTREINVIVARSRKSAEIKLIGAVSAKNYCCENTAQNKSYPGAAPVTTQGLEQGGHFRHRLNEESSSSSNQRGIDSKDLSEAPLLST